MCGWNWWNLCVRFVFWFVMVICIVCIGIVGLFRSVGILRGMIFGCW